MEAITLHPGDVFCTRNPASLGRAINAIQSIVSRDGKSVYSHAGIILDETGATLEALGKCKVQNLFEVYSGHQVFIARWDGMNQRIFQLASQVVLEENKGRRYPIWRLLFHMSPTAAKYVSAGGKYVVCSELVAKFLYLAHIYGGYTDLAGYCWPRHRYFCGTSPDTLADEWHRWRNFERVFEGILTLNEEEDNEK